MSKDKLLSLIVDAENALNQLDAYLAIFELVTDEQVRDAAAEARNDLSSVNIDKLKSSVEEL